MTKIRRMRPALGTYVEVGIDDKSVINAIEAAYAAIAEVETRLSFHSPASDLTRLNCNPGRQVPLHATSLRVLRLARAMTHASDGAFNCTVGGALVTQGALPDHGGTDMIEVGEAADIEIGAGWARLVRPVRLTLDGIAKGYAVDAAVAAMRRHGASAGWVNAGGDLRVFGDIALPVHRRETDGRLTSLGSLRRGALASSRGATMQETGHDSVIIGTTGQAPVPGVWSVLARTAWRADALTKVACCTPIAQRADLVTRLGGYLVPGMPVADRMAA